MAANLNKVILMGTLGKDPEVRTIPSGKKVANFSIATNESYTDKGGQKVEKTEWHKIVIWDKLAEIVEKYLKTGSQVYLEGKIATRSWDDDQGNKKYSTEIVAHTMQMLGGKGESSQKQEVPSHYTPPQPIPPAEEDNLPF